MRKSLLLAATVSIVALLFFIWQRLQTPPLPEGFAGSNGRIEATEIDVATKTAGRLISVEANEGDFVSAGHVLAQMDTDVLVAELKQAEAERREAESTVVSAKSNVTQRESEKAAAESLVLQRNAELDLASANLKRAESLAGTNAITREETDTIRASFYSAQAAVSTAEAHVAGADAAIATAQSQVIRAEAAVGAAEASIERLKADIKDSTLTSPRDGRVQFRISEPGEVLDAGGKVLNFVDLGDVYMTFFLPTLQAGRVQMGSEARIVLDAAPQLVIPARVTFVADVAQFTPKTVETAEERQKLVFRIKARIDPALLKEHIRQVKTGLPGMAYVRLDPQAVWPPELEVRIPQ